MQVKLLMTWDIKPGLDQEYFQFVMREFVPNVGKLGVRLTQAWYTVYGDPNLIPQIMVEGISDDYSKLKQTLDGPEWKVVHDKLLEFVTDYKQKVVRQLPRFQL